MPTKDHCKTIIARIGYKFKISGRLISERLLDESDKEAMLNGEVTLECLEQHVRLWIANEMPDYANGNTEPYEAFWG